MNTTTNTGKVAAVAKGFLLAVLIACVGAVLYMYYRSSEPCRVLQSISNNSRLNEDLKEGLVEYLKLENVRIFLQQSAGEVFSIADFGVEFPDAAALGELNVKNQNIQLVIKTDRSDKSFRAPYNVNEVGIGYSRAYLMYVNDSEIRNAGVEALNLSSDSYVDCRVRN